MEKNAEFSETKFMSSQPEEQIEMLKHKEEEDWEEEKAHQKDVEKHKEEMAKKLKDEQKKKMKRMKDSSMEDKLKLLLDQAEKYTQFMLANEHHEEKPGSAKKSKKSKNKESKRKHHLKDDSDPDEKYVLTRLIAQPSKLKGKLRPYQLDGLNWLINLYEKGLSGILADEMGLGKTIQTISLIAFLKEYKKVERYFLIIVPKSCIPNWVKEFKAWLPDMKVVNLIARKEARAEILKKELLPNKFDVCVTTYEGARICSANLRKFKWEYMIVDEAHKLKNESSVLSQQLRSITSKYRLLLTGTPLQNNLQELWALLNFLVPELFSSAEDFHEFFDLSRKGTDKETEDKNKDVISKLHKILKPFLLRRIKKEAEKSLPPKTELHIKVGLTETQKKIYRDLLTKSAIESGSTFSFFKNLVMQLRKACNHPYLFEGVEEEGQDEFGEHLVDVCGKMRVLDKLMSKCVAENNQVLIFSTFTSMLDILEDYCGMRDYDYCRLDGTTDLDEREDQIEEFTKKNSPKKVFLISTRAGGLGINLMTANIVVLYDSDWNPQIDLQAMDRAHRIGQKKPVSVFRFITESTIEEKMIEKQALKLKLDSVIIQRGRMATKTQGFSKDELKDVVNYGADEIFKVGDAMTDEDIETMINKGLENANELHDKVNDKVDDKKFDMINFEMKPSHYYDFEDEDYLKKRREEQKKIINENVVKMLNDQVKTGRRDKHKALKNLNEAHLFPNLNSANNGPTKKKITLQDYKFYSDAVRLKELLEKEQEGRFDPKHRLTEEEKTEKNEIYESGFIDWDKKEYFRFIRALEMFGTNDYTNIADHVQTKTPEQVEKYAKVFFARVNELADAPRIKAIIEKTSKMLEFKSKAPELIERKVRAYQDPYEEMVIYPTQKSKFFSKESDVILLCLTHKYSYGNWSKIKKALRAESKTRFDHLLLSRTEKELQRRVDILVKGLEKELKDEVKKKKKKDKVEMHKVEEPDANGNNINISISGILIDGNFKMLH